jgi:hypothetical protein
MNKKAKDWLTVALGIGVLAKGVYDLLSDDEDDDSIEYVPKAIEGKSKYADMEEAEVITEEKNEEVNKK